MDQWEGTIIRSSSAKVQTFLGLSNSVHDRDTWQQFLVSKHLAVRHLIIFIIDIDFPRQRLSKDFHNQLEIGTACSWGSTELSRKVTYRRQLKKLCFQKGFLVGRDIEPALEWRLYQLQRNRKAESRIKSG